ncbi:hypothetical protein ACFST9_25355 [Hymenobacter monticola]|uniref:Macroglobulin domain-containing protein n=1 Tax=Hymenobacter monticola TaxID=1705399 RepID=A0ABY4B6B7_9BACT|nr:hypothetical protein [Hymenobacter monticola]UOE34699.1 hypothetical protein MTP16_03380 [Hymenobacter monticola]
MEYYPLLTYCRRRARLLGAAAAWLLSLGAARAQQPADSLLPAIGPRFAAYSQRVPTEKLYLHVDRPSYLSGETMWFNAYTVAAAPHRPLAASKVAYVEVLDRENVPVLQTKIGLVNATGWGSLVLPVSLPSGRYTVRAYTRWMQNGDPELYFHTTVGVVNTHTQPGLPAAGPAAAPDAQFFPEGGHLVQGLLSKVGFKVTDGAGHGVAATGVVLAPNGARVAQFATLRQGLGNFSFVPASAGGGYRAEIKLANRPPISVSLPVVETRGYVLRLEDASPDRLRLVVQATGTGDAEERLFLLAHAGQQVAVAATGQLFEGKAMFSVAKAGLADGVSHFTLFNSRRQPVCERLYFRPPTQLLRLAPQTDKPQYGTREKVSLRLTVPGPANLSVAVYQLDSLSAAGGTDVAPYLWLTSELRGVVENPEYYVTGQGPDRAEAADNLMLTQGWSRFRWADVLAPRPEPLQHLPELNGHVVRGRVVQSATGAPVANVPVYLTVPGRHFQLYNSVSRPDGSIRFELPALHGPTQLIVQPNTERDTLYRVDLLSPFSTRYAQRPAASLQLPPGWAASLRRRHVQSEVQLHFQSKPPVYPIPRPDTVAFYGKPDERYYLDQFTRFKTLEEVMREYVPGVMVRTRKDGFHFLVLDHNARNVLESPLVLLDGMPVFDTNKIMAIDPLKIKQLDVITARYFHGPLVYNGVVSYTTYKGDLGGAAPDPYALLQDYEGLQAQREFYAPRYDTPQAAQNRLPDFRNLLYWNPNASGEELTFYTSDQAGKYRVVVQGLSPNGAAGSGSFDFEVKPPL